MNIFIAADHRGFEFKEKIKDWLKKQGYQVIDCGNKVYDPNDDYPDYSLELSRRLISTKAMENGALGIVICGSGVGVSVAANRVKGIRCGLGFDADQIKHARENDHINVLALPSDYLSLEKAKKFISTFLKAKPKNEERYLRRIRKLDNSNLVIK